MTATREYAFDVRLCATVRIRAANKAEALATLRDAVGSADCNAGAWPNGDPILFEAILDDEDPQLVEVDGEWVG